jgi:hypothetical protein
MRGNLTIAVVGAGGKMGTRVSDNLAETAHTVYYAENHPPARQRVEEAGRTLTETDSAVRDADVVILAVRPGARDVVAAQETDTPGQRAVAEVVIRAMYAPVLDVHRVTVKQLAVLEPTLVETVACMIGALRNEALQEEDLRGSRARREHRSHAAPRRRPAPGMTDALVRVDPGATTP